MGADGWGEAFANSAWSRSDNARADYAPGHHRVFVYGTLLAGERNHTRICPFWRAKEVCRCEDHDAILPSGTFRLLDTGSFPALIKVPVGGVAISGKVFSAPTALLRTLDGFEGVPTLYVRAEVLVARHSTGPVRAWTYLWARNNEEAYHIAGTRASACTLLPHGNWKKRFDR